MPAKGKIQAMFTSSWETILKASDRDDMNWNCKRVGEKPMERELVLKETYDSNITVLQN